MFHFHYDAQLASLQVLNTAEKEKDVNYVKNLSMH